MSEGKRQDSRYVIVSHSFVAQQRRVGDCGSHHGEICPQRAHATVAHECADMAKRLCGTFHVFHELSSLFDSRPKSILLGGPFGHKAGLVAFKCHSPLDDSLAFNWIERGRYGN
jgi:hypothetical protein